MLMLLVPRNTHYPVIN